MTNKEIFITTVEQLIAHSKDMIPTEALEYFNQLKATPEKEKPPFTEGGAKALIWMQENWEAFNNIFKAKNVAEGLFLPSSRSVAGSMRKLVTDGYVSKIEGTPTCYSLTEKGKTVTVVIPEKKEKED